MIFNTASIKESASGEEGERVRRGSGFQGGFKGTSKRLKYVSYIPSVFVLLSVFFASSCGVSSGRVAAASPEVSKVKKVAILPFGSLSGKTNASETVTGIFITKMFNLGKFQVEEPGNILEFMVREGMNTLGEIDIENLKMMSEHLELDAVIVGTVEEYDDGRTSVPPVPVVSITARMIEPRNGKIIWSAKNRRSGEDYLVVFDFGRVRSVTTLTEKVIDEMIRNIK